MSQRDGLLLALIRRLAIERPPAVPAGRARNKVVFRNYRGRACYLLPCQGAFARHDRASERSAAARDDKKRANFDLVDVTFAGSRGCGRVPHQLRPTGNAYAEIARLMRIGC